MAMAHHAPFDTYKRKNFIHPHAILRLHERLKVMGRIEHRPDMDLGNLIDSVVTSAFVNGAAQRFEDARGEGWLIDLTELFDYSLVAMARRANGVQNKKVVVTILDTTIGQYMALLKRGVQSGDVLEADGLENETLLPESTGAKLADTPAGAKLAQFKIAPVQDAPKEDCMPTPAIVAPNPTQPVNKLDERLLCWPGKDGNKVYARYQAADLGKAVTDLVDSGVPLGFIEVWAQKDTKFKFVVVAVD